MKTRIFSGLVGVILLIGIVLWGALPLRIAVVLVSFCMLYELFRAANLLKKASLFIPSAVFTTLTAADIVPDAYREMMLAIFLLLLFTAAVFNMQKNHTQDVGVSLLFSLFVGMFMGCITKIRMEAEGAYLIWLVFIGAWVSDTFAFFVGKFLGRKKLIPKVSPKKTVEGALGAVVGTGIAYFVYGVFAFMHLGNINPYVLVVLGMLVSVCGQIGDLAASSVKRHYGIKDFGSIMPGHGGFMDRFDSILFVAPAVYFCLQFLN